MIPFLKELYHNLPPYTPVRNLGSIIEKLEKETLKLSDSSKYAINNVLDPLRISHCGIKIRLIGLKLKSNVNPNETIAVLKRAVLFQFVQLEFDSGKKLDEKGARGAFVYWIMKGNKKISHFTREGLSSVPFNKKTLVNSYLLDSGLYEIDKNSINNPKLMEKLTLKEKYLDSEIE